MPCFITHHQSNDVLQQRVLCSQLERVERRQGKALDNDLHADKLQVPARFGENLVEQHFQVFIDRIKDADLFLQVASNNFNKEGLIIQIGITTCRTRGSV